MFQDKVILASQSPRRWQILRQRFNNIKKLSLVGDEPRWVKKQKPFEYLNLCLDFKSKLALSAIAAETPKDSLPIKPTWLVVADTIVVLGREVLGKPINKKDAREILFKLSNKTHLVFTGIWTKNLQTGEIFSGRCESKVQFRKLSPVEIKNYVLSGSPMDKAGAYGFQDEALKFISSVQGSYLNIVGFPLDFFLNLIGKSSGI
jgi:MAF protein